MCKVGEDKLTLDCLSGIILITCIYYTIRIWASHTRWHIRYYVDEHTIFQEKCWLTTYIPDDINKFGGDVEEGWPEGMF